MAIAPTEPDEAASVCWGVASAVAAAMLALVGALALAGLLAGAGASASGEDSLGVAGGSATSGHHALLRALPRAPGPANPPPHGDGDVEAPSGDPAAPWASPLVPALLDASCLRGLEIGVACRMRPHGRAQSPRAPPPHLTA